MINRHRNNRGDGIRRQRPKQAFNIPQFKT